MTHSRSGHPIARLNHRTNRMSRVDWVLIKLNFTKNLGFMQETKKAFDVHIVI